MTNRQVALDAVTRILDDIILWGDSIPIDVGHRMGNNLDTIRTYLEQPTPALPENVQEAVSRMREKMYNAEDYIEHEDIYLLVSEIERLTEELERAKAIVKIGEENFDKLRVSYDNLKYTNIEFHKDLVAERTRHKQAERERDMLAMKLTATGKCPPGRKIDSRECVQNCYLCWLDYVKDKPLV